LLEDTTITAPEVNIIEDKNKLPKLLHPYFSIDLIKDGNIKDAEKLALVKVYGKASKEWSAPKTEMQKIFAIDSVIL